MNLKDTYDLLFVLYVARNEPTRLIDLCARKKISRAARMFILSSGFHYDILLFLSSL